MANQIVISSGAKVRNLNGVLTGSTGVVSSVPLGAANGVATLDATGKVPSSQLPTLANSYKGTWNASTNTPTIADGTGTAGDYYLVSVAGTQNLGSGSITFAVGNNVIYSGTIWQKSGTAAGVTSVGLSTNGGAITIGSSPVTSAGTITANFNGTNLQYVNGAGNLTTFPTLLSSVGLSMPSAFSVANSPLTANGTIAVTGAGTTAQYIRGDGSLATFPAVASEAQRLITEVYNSTGATLTKGTVVYINGGQGNLPTVTKALATGDATSAQTYGVVQANISNMSNGFVVAIGSLTDLDTQAYANGTQLYLSSTVAGAWTSVKQYAPAHLVYVAIVTRSHPTQGVVEVKIQNGFEMDELHDVSAQTPSNGGILQYVTSTGLWTAVAGTTTNIAQGTNLYYTDALARASNSFVAGSGAYNSTTGVITIPTNNNQITNGSNYITLGSLSGGVGISYNNTTGVITNSAPDQTVSLTAGTGISVTGTYPSFSIASTITQYTNALARTSISLTTTGTSGAATYNNTTGVFNIPNYTPDLSNYVDLTTNQTIGGTKTFSNATKNNGGILLQNASSSSLAGYMNLGGLTDGVRFTSGGGISNSFTLPSATGYTYTFPNATGTIALTSQLTSGTVTSVGLSSATSGVTIGSTPVTTSGTITLAIATATTSQNGLLSSTDWTTFNNKASTASLANYLPLAGGTLTGPLTTSNINIGIGGTEYPNGQLIFQTTTSGSYVGIGTQMLGAAVMYFDHRAGANTGSFVFRNGTGGGNTLLTIGSGAYNLDVNGTGRFSGTITSSTGNNTRLFTSTGATTGYQYMDMYNTTGRLVWGINGSTANALSTNSLAYGGVIYAENSLQLGVGGDMKVTIASTGAATFTGSVTATSFFESSDSRLKTLIQDNYQTKGIASITPKLYTKNGKVELGYYAQDLVGVLDSAVVKGEDEMLSLSYREVHTAKIYALEQRIKELEAKFN
jgi:hypothetical protein